MVGGGLAPVPGEDLDPAMVQEVQRESSGYTLDVLKDRLRPRDAVEATPRDYTVVDRGLAPVGWEDLDPAMVQEVQRESSGCTLDVLKDRLRPREAVETTPGGDEYVVCDAVTPNSPCHVPNPDVDSECGLSELPSSIHSEDKTKHDAFFVQTCLELVGNTEYAAPQKPLLSMRGEKPSDEELDPQSRRREYVDSKNRLVAKELCYAKPTRG